MIRNQCLLDKDNECEYASKFPFNALPVKFIESKDYFCVDFGEVIFIHDGEYYLGPYIVDPKPYEQVLDTKDKFMNNNVTINPAPEAKAIVTGTLLELIGNFPIEVL